MFLRDYVVVFLTNVECGSSPYIDACDSNSNIPKLSGYRGKLGASYEAMVDAHENTPREMFTGRNERFGFMEVNGRSYM